MQTTTPMHRVDDRLSVPAHTHALNKFTGVKKHKSVWRAIRRRTVGIDGEVLPTRPFNNSKRTKGRTLQKDFEKANTRFKSYMKRRKNM